MKNSITRKEVFPTCHTVAVPFGAALQESVKIVKRKR